MNLARSSSSIGSPSSIGLLPAASLALAVTFVLSGCSAAPAGEFAAEGRVVAEFFDLLQSGESGGIAELLSDGAVLGADVLEEDFYAAAVARPEDAVVGEGFEFEPGLIYVPVKYTLDGQERSISVSVEESGGEPRITGWLKETLSIDPLRAPGAFEINGSLPIGALEESTQFVALPGLYTIEYVDPDGLGTVDPEGEPTRSFEVEFPIDSNQLEASVPAGVIARGSGIGAEPRLLASVEEDVESQLAAIVEQCTASALVGESCPSDLVDEANSGPPVDSNTVIWTDESEQHGSPTNEWEFVAEYSVAFNRFDTPGRITFDTTLAGVITAGPSGSAVLTVR